MGSEGGEATSHENLGDFGSGLQAAPCAAAGVRSRITMPRYREPLPSRTNPAAIAGDEQLCNLLSRVCEAVSRGQHWRANIWHPNNLKKNRPAANWPLPTRQDPNISTTPLARIELSWAGTRKCHLHDVS